MARSPRHRPRRHVLLLARVRPARDLTRTLAVEWARHRIRVNAISPGIVDTPGAAAQLWANPEVRDALVQKIPLRRFGTEDEIAKTAAFLVSEDASYITGEVLVADGGAW